MKELPGSFQMRVKGYPAYTHKVKRNAHGDYEVTWARGWAEVIQQVPWRIADSREVENAIRDGDWIVVEDKPKQKDVLLDVSASAKPAAQLPSQFYFKHIDSHIVFKAALDSVCPGYNITWDKQGHESFFYIEDAATYVGDGRWKILDKPVRTPEQERALKQYKEQIAQLDSSIRINEQSVEHYLRLIAGYEERQKELLAKVEELEGK
jgi:hypothetical protein